MQLNEASATEATQTDKLSVQFDVSVTTLTQPELQFLLAFLKEETKELLDQKDNYAEWAQRFWEQSEKGTVAGESAFRRFSYNHQQQKATKEKIKKLSKIIHKLKTMR